MSRPNAQSPPLIAALLPVVAYVGACGFTPVGLVLSQGDYGFASVGTVLGGLIPAALAVVGLLLVRAGKRAGGWVLIAACLLALSLSVYWFTRLEGIYTGAMVNADAPSRAYFSDAAARDRPWNLLAALLLGLPTLAGGSAGYLLYARVRARTLERETGA